METERITLFSRIDIVEDERTGSGDSGWNGHTVEHNHNHCGTSDCRFSVFSANEDHRRCPDRWRHTLDTAHIDLGRALKLIPLSLFLSVNRSERRPLPAGPPQNCPLED